MKKKIIGIFVCMLMILTAVLPVTGTLNQNIIIDKQFENKEILNQAESEEDWWTMFRHDPGNTGCSSSEAPGTNELCWQQTTFDGFGVTAPLVVKDKLYISTGAYYKTEPLESFGLQLPSNHEKQFTLFDIIKARGIVPNKQYYGTLYCLDAVNGTILWDFYIGLSSDPAVVDDKVYITQMDYYYSYNSKVYCLNANTGGIIWQRTIGEWLISSSVIVADDKLYVGSFDFYSYSGKLYCLNAQNGNTVWTYNMPPNELMYFSSAAVADQMVYFISLDLYSYDYGTLFCLNAGTGQFKWSQPIGYSELCSPVVSDGQVYAVSFDPYSYYGCINCFNAVTGSPVWTFDLGFYQFTFSNPAVYNNRVFFPVLDYSIYNGKVYCIDADSGGVIWSVQTSEVSFYSSPAVADGKVYVPLCDFYGDSGKLYCLDADDGDQIWSYSIDFLTISSPAIASGCVFLPDYYGNIYAIGYPNDPPTPPSIDGQTNGKPGKSYDYTFVSTDPEAEDIYYAIYWGDGVYSGWLGPYGSGVAITQSHTWDESGTYNISAMAKDIHDFKSNWSSLEVTMPKDKAFLNSMSLEILKKLLERFPLLKEILNL
jgi:outer membrane protein assembly factor BamB